MNSITLAALALTFVTGDVVAQKPARVRTLTIGAYTTPREVFAQRILPGFARQWKRTSGDSLRFESSYVASGAQSRAIVSGFPADVAILSLEADIDAIAKAKLLHHDWRRAAYGGIVSRSLVVLAVRRGNPKHIATWDDLRRPGLQVLTPNPATSGGAMWNIAALVGAALRGATQAPAGDSAAAERLLADVLRNVSIMDKGGRESMLTFEQGVGDVAITYENEVIAARQAGKAVDYVVPPQTLWIESSAAVVDENADEHGTSDVASAFIQYLSSAEAQQAFADFGYRPVSDAIRLTGAGVALAPVGKPFTVRDMGGWPAVTRALFAPGGMFSRAQARARSR